MEAKLPEGWRLAPFKRLARNVNERWEPGDEQADYIGLEHIASQQGRLLDKESSATVTSAKTRFRRGDTLFGKLRPNLRKFIRAGFDGICSTDILALRPHGEADEAFIYYIVQSEHFVRYAINDASGTKMPRTSWKRLAELPCPIPPLAEQQRIAEILTAVDDSIRAGERVIEQSERVKKGLMEELLGEAHEVRSLAEASEFITKGSTPTTYGFEWQSDGIPFLRSECVGENGFTESGLAYIGEDAHHALQRSALRPGDILITITGNVGRVAVLPDQYPAANMNQHIARVRLSASDIDAKYVQYYLSKPSKRRHFESIVTGLAYPQLSLKQIRETEIALPPLPEQRRIAAILSSVDDQIGAERRHVEQQKRLKRGLMDDLLTGRVRTV